jgi:hypothetical protein
MNSQIKMRTDQGFLSSAEEVKDLRHGEEARQLKCNCFMLNYLWIAPPFSRRPVDPSRDGGGAGRSDAPAATSKNTANLSP